MKDQVKQLIEKYQERQYNLERTKSLLHHDYDVLELRVVEIKLVEIGSFIADLTDLKTLGE